MLDQEVDRILPIKLVIFDIDGVMTDGRLVLDNNGVESKFFHSRDGLGMKLLVQAGIKTAIITARTSKIVELRAKELRVSRVYQGALDKISSYRELLSEMNLAESETAYGGDDILDLPVMRQAGLAMAPADAVDEVKAVSHYVCRACGGKGAVREMCELILKAQGRWADILAAH